MRTALLVFVALAACGSAPDEPAPTRATTTALAATASASSAPSTAPPQSARATLPWAEVLRVLQTPPKDKVADRALLEKVRDRSSGDDREIMQRLLAAYDRAVTAFEARDVSQPTMKALLDDTVAIMQALVKAHPEDATLVNVLAASLFAVPEQAASMKLDPGPYEPLRAEAVAVVDDLARRFPDVAEVHANRGNLCALSRGDPATCVKAFDRCLELAPRDERCAAARAQLAPALSATPSASASSAPKKP